MSSIINQYKQILKTFTIKQLKQEGFLLRISSLNFRKQDYIQQIIKKINEEIAASRLQKFKSRVSINSSEAPKMNLQIKINKSRQNSIKRYSKTLQNSIVKNLSQINYKLQSKKTNYTLIHNLLKIQLVNELPPQKINTQEHQPRRYLEKIFGGKSNLDVKKSYGFFMKNNTDKHFPADLKKVFTKNQEEMRSTLLNMYSMNKDLQFFKQDPFQLQILALLKNETTTKHQLIIDFFQLIQQRVNYYIEVIQMVEDKEVIQRLIRLISLQGEKLKESISKNVIFLFILIHNKRIQQKQDLIWDGYVEFWQKTISKINEKQITRIQQFMDLVKSCYYYQKLNLQELSQVSEDVLFYILDSAQKYIQDIKEYSNNIKMQFLLNFITISQNNQISIFIIKNIFKIIQSLGYLSKITASSLIKFLSVRQKFDFILRQHFQIMIEKHSFDTAEDIFLSLQLVIKYHSFEFCYGLFKNLEQKNIIIKNKKLIQFLNSVTNMIMIQTEKLQMIRIMNLVCRQQKELSQIIF